MPTSPNDQVRRSNILLSWQSDRVKIDGNEWVGITAVGYEEKLERTIVHGNKKDATPLGMTRGKYSVTSCTITMLRDSAAQLKQYLANKGGVGSHGAAEFQIDVQHVEPNQSVIAATISGCRWGGSKRDDKEGTDALTEDVTIYALSVLETLDGVTTSLFTDTEQA